MRVAVVGAVAARGADEDEPLLLDALAAAGADARAVAWDDDGVDWSAVDLAVLRSTWDYAERCGQFLAWCRRVDAATRLVNPVDVVVWNADKTYLRELARASVALVDDDDDGRPLVLEVELIEPSLFLTTDAGAADRFAAALLAPGPRRR